MLRKNSFPLFLSLNKTPAKHLDLDLTVSCVNTSPQVPFHWMECVMNLTWNLLCKSDKSWMGLNLPSSSLLTAVWPAFTNLVFHSLPMMHRWLRCPRLLSRRQKHRRNRTTDLHKIIGIINAIGLCLARRPNRKPCFGLQGILPFRKESRD